MPEQPPLRHYFEILRSQAWLIAALVLAALVVSGVATAFQKSVYRASMGMVVGQGGGVFEPEFGGSAEPFTLTLSNLLRTNVVAERVADNLRLEASPDEVLRNIRVRSRPESSVLDISYDSTDKDFAVLVVREIGRVFTRLVDEKLGADTSGRAGAGDGAEITARVFDPAHLEPGRVAPRPARTFAFAGLLGLALGIALAFARESIDDRIRRPTEAAEWFGAPVIGTLPREIYTASATAALTDRRGVFEALQLLCAKIQFSQGPVRGPAIVVTSAQETEGKSTIAANLSVALATAGRDVVCVGADFYRPTLHEFFNLPADAPGLIDVMNSRAEFADVFQSVRLSELAAGRHQPPTLIAGARRGVRMDRSPPVSPRGRLRVITAGRVEGGALRVLDERRLAVVVDGLRASADYVIFDSPPVLLVGDAYPLLVAADSVIVVARGGRTTQGIAEAVRATLESLGVEEVGVILAGSQERVDSVYSPGAYRALELTSSHEQRQSQ